jgi:hypothetical protein
MAYIRELLDKAQRVEPHQLTKGEVAMIVRFRGKNRKQIREALMGRGE